MTFKQDIDLHLFIKFRLLTISLVQAYLTYKNSSEMHDNFQKASFFLNLKILNLDSEVHIIYRNVYN